MPYRAFCLKPARSLFAAAVFGCVMPAGFFRVMRCVKMVSVRDVRVMTALFVIAGFMVLCRFTMMTRGVFVMLRRAVVMFRPLMFSHDLSP
jgi:hypothetical protein